MLSSLLYQCLVHIVICAYGDTSQVHCDAQVAELPRIEMDSPDRTALATQLDAALHELGVVELVNHNIPSWAIRSAYDGGKAFFARDLADKLKYRLRDTAKCGYTPLGALKANDDDFETEEYDDGADDDAAELFFLQLKQLQYSGTTLNVPVDGDDSLLDPDLMLSAWPYIRSLAELRKDVHGLVGVALGLENHLYFEEQLMTNPNLHYPMFIHLHYPPVCVMLHVLLNCCMSGDDQRNESNAELRLKSHTDVMTFTFVANDGVQGLQLLVEDEWRFVRPTQKDSILLFAGDAAKVYTNDWWRSIKHRVVWPEDEATANADRLTMSYFAGPDYDQLIQPISGCAKCNASNTRYKPRTVAEHFRLRFDTAVVTD